MNKRRGHSIRISPSVYRELKQYCNMKGLIKGKFVDKAITHQIANEIESEDIVEPQGERIIRRKVK